MSAPLRWSRFTWRECPDVPNLPIYLDNHATTRVDPRVVEAMLPHFTMTYGNAASVSHRFGWEAAEAVDRSREQIARLIGAEVQEIILTSGGTESNNLAIKGGLPGLKSRGNHVVTAATEHKSVLDPLKRLAREGWELTVVPPAPDGLISVESIANSLTGRTVLVSIMAANNEVGTLNPIAAIGRLCRARGILFHVDAIQAVGKVPLDVNDDSIDLLSLSAHKIYGPKGVGALFVRRGDPPVRLVPLFDGGGHERGFRSGTVAVPLVVGLGEAAALASLERAEESARLLALRERLHAAIAGRVPAIRLNGHPTLRLPGNLNLSFADVDGEALMMAMRDVAVSSGSACTSANPEPSHVLRAMGVDEAMARASLRFGLGRFTTAEEIDFAADAVARAVMRLRGKNVSADAP
ncbi:cysteine desulfurase family protein [Singulisphaera acidiphila DSM 18658]|uniref:cysteine desulfurase n=1 Tax=Singulisphaera acidiphila (strain ATCC BAA-1392 / DSM 18658 / VKM B-2454 / MOB10) TaxID=886293 RepID=L0DEY2_SINAD|nr:cysteine desulfurase family protein [Singulisphaera acidiphila DSM 18658]